MSTPTASDLILAHMVNRALDRAFAAAEVVQARHPQVTAQVALGPIDDLDPAALDAERLPEIEVSLWLPVAPGVDYLIPAGSITFLVSTTTATMIAELEAKLGDPVSLPPLEADD